MSKVKISPPKSKGRYSSDVSWISEGGQEMRDALTGFYVPVMSYPGAPIPSGQERHEKQKAKDPWFPDSKFFDPQRFVDALEYVGWEFHGTRYNGRKPTSKWKQREFGKDIEEIPEDLEPYTLQAEDDLPKILSNTQKRVKSFRPESAFGSPNYGSYLSQELYEAGWYWLSTPANIRSIKDVWKGETLP